MEESVCCSIIEVGHTVGKQYFKRNIFIDIINLKDKMKKLDNFGVFTTVFRYECENQDNSLMIGNLYIDLDEESDFEKVRKDSLIAISFLDNIFKIDSENINIYYSGKKGIHMTINHNILGIEPMKNLNCIFANIAKDILNISSNKTIDTSIYDNKRLFRIPNSIHQDTGLYKIPISFEELKNLSVEEIKELAKKPRTLKRKELKIKEESKRIFKEYVKQTEKQFEDNLKIKPKTVIDYTPPCIVELLNSNTNKGSRNNILAILASHIKDRGYSKEKCIERLNEWNDNFCNPKMTKLSIKNTTNSIYRGNKSFGCTSIKMHTECHTNECRFKQGR